MQLFRYFVIFICFFINISDAKKCYISSNGNGDYYLCHAYDWYNLSCGYFKKNFWSKKQGILWVPMKTLSCDYDCKKVNAIAIYDTDKQKLFGIKSPDEDAELTCIHSSDDEQEGCYIFKGYYLCMNSYWHHNCGYVNDTSDTQMGVLWVPIKTDSCVKDCRLVNAVPYMLFNRRTTPVINLKSPAPGSENSCIFGSKTTKL